MAGSPLASESKRMVRNLQRLYLEQSIQADRVTGREWYPHAHQIVCEWADTFERSIVLYFLSNATTWRGDDARRIKAELKKLAGVK